MGKNITNLIGKPVIVLKIDRYTKTGILKSISEQYIVLQFFDGKEEIISFGVINNVRLNTERT